MSSCFASFDSTEQVNMLIIFTGPRSRMQTSQTGGRQKLRLGGAATAQWICLCLPSCSPGFESEAHHLYFYRLCYICHGKKGEKKRSGLAHFFKKYTTMLTKQLHQ